MASPASDETNDTTITVYGFHLGDTPNGDLTPFGTKLLTFLKMSKTDYKYVGFLEHNGSGSPKGKMPWIHAPGLLGDDNMGDSSMIIKALVKADPTKYDFDSHLSAQDKAIGLAMKTMMEESTYWAIVHMRWNTEEFSTVTVPTYFPGYHWSAQKLIGWYLGRSTNAQLKGQGTGLLTDEEITTKANAEILALSEFLGTKKYLMGSQITSYDATLYAFLIGIIKGEWNHPVCKKTRGYKNLVDYVERMQKEYWL